MDHLRTPTATRAIQPVSPTQTHYTIHPTIGMPGETDCLTQRVLCCVLAKCCGTSAGHLGCGNGGCERRCSGARSCYAAVSTRLQIINRCDERSQRTCFRVPLTACTPLCPQRAVHNLCPVGQPTRPPPAAVSRSPQLTTHNASCSAAARCIRVFSQ